MSSWLFGRSGVGWAGGLGTSLSVPGCPSRCGFLRVEAFAKKWRGLGIPPHFRGCHARGHLHYLSLVGDFRVALGGRLGIPPPQLDAIVEAGFCLVFHVVL